MPVRDGARWLDAAIGSVLSQEGVALELIVVDDGSRDATPAMLAAWAARDPRVRVLAAGGGMVAALHLGLAAARAPLVARLDADDEALPGRLARQAAAFAEPALLALGGAAITMDAQGRDTGRADMPRGAAAMSALAERSPLLHPAAMFRRDAALALGGYRPALVPAEDYDLWLRLAAHGRLDNLAEPVIRQRLHAGQVSRRRRLAQRAAAALARGLAARGVPPAATLAATLAAQLAARGADPTPLAGREARDVAVMLRALPDAAARTVLLRRLRREAGGWRNLVLPLRLRLDAMARGGRAPCA